MRDSSAPHRCRFLHCGSQEPVINRRFQATEAPQARTGGVMSSEIEESDAEAQSVHHIEGEIDESAPELPLADAVAELKGTRSS